jgi:hypothetical protein
LNYPVLLQNSMFTRNRVLFVLLGAILVPIILNGYPIIFQDSGTYISAYANVSSFLRPSPQRSEFYAFYVFITSLGGVSLFLVCISQAFVVSVLLRDLLCAENCQSNLLIIAIALIIPFSFLAVQSCCLMPDVWTSIEFLAAYLLITGTERRKYFYAALIALSAMFAPASGIILAGATVLLVVIGYFVYGPRRTPVARLPLAAAAVLLGLALPTIDYEISYGVAAPIADSGSFLFANLTGDGLTKTVLDRYCKSSSNVICAKRSIYEGKDSQTILWGWPGAAIDIWNPSNQKVLNAIDRAAVIENPLKFLREITRRTFLTLMSFPDDLSHLYYGPYAPDSWVYSHIASLYGAAGFSRSWQQSAAGSFPYLKYYKYVLLFGIAASAILFVRHKLYRSEHDAMLVIYSGLFVLANAAITGGLSEITSRYNVKAVDMAVLTIFIVIVQQVQKIHRHRLAGSKEEAPLEPVLP